jgi:hypothetical protein
MFQNPDTPTPAATKASLESLDTLAMDGDINETPHNVFIGHNLGHRVFTMSVPFRKFFEISDVANDRESGPVAQRPLDMAHAKKLAAYMLKGLVSAAKMKRMIQGKSVPDAFNEIIRALGEQPYFSLQPIVCNIRNIPLGGDGPNGVRGMRLSTVQGETASFRVFLAERHTLWVVDGQHRRKGADNIRSLGKYPGKTASLYPEVREVTASEMLVWNEAHDAARSFATITIEAHLGLDIYQERQLFHDLNNLGKKVDRSLALQFDSANPITLFIRDHLVSELALQVADQEIKDWSDDDGSLALKDIVATNAIAFMNKGNISGATPLLIEPKVETVARLWQRIIEVPNFGTHNAKERTVLAQPVVLKALAKITYDLAFSNRKPPNADELFEKFLNGISTVDFSHSNPMWRFYDLTEPERKKLGGLGEFLPSEESGNRDVGSYQNGIMRFGAKHNDIFPLLADMIRWRIGLPNRHR